MGWAPPKSTTFFDATPKLLPRQTLPSLTRPPKPSYPNFRLSLVLPSNCISSYLARSLFLSVYLSKTFVKILRIYTSFKILFAYNAIQYKVAYPPPTLFVGFFFGFNNPRAHKFLLVFTRFEGFCIEWKQKQNVVVF